MSEEIQYLGSSNTSDKESTHLFSQGRQLLKVYTIRSEGIIINPSAMVNSLVPWMISHGYSTVRQSEEDFSKFEPVW